MTARLFRLTPVQTVPAALRPASPGLLEQAPVSEHTWYGASGRKYAHAVYSLIACPPLPKANFMLVRRNANGTRTVLHIGCGQDDAPTANLARVRQRGAQLGANEVHVSIAAAGDSMRSLVVCDLRAGQFGGLGPEPLNAAA